MLRSGLTTFWWSVASAGVFFIAREPEFDAIDRYNFDDHRAARLGRLAQQAAPINCEFDGSRNGRCAPLPQQQVQAADLMLVDNFK